MDDHLHREDSPISPLSSAPEHLLHSLPQTTPTSYFPRQPSITLGQHIRLACQACQRKKIKCDRTFPCGQCTRSGLHCVASQRKPRARHVGKKNVDSELRSRISKLESLVETLSGEVALHAENGDDGHADASTPNSGKHVGLNPSSNAASPANSSDPTSITSPSVRKYIGSAFWASLSDEVHALREALEDEDPGCDEPEPAFVEILTDPNSDEYDLLVCPPGKIFVMPNAMSEPSMQAQVELYGLYLRSVAPIYHIFHTPSLQKLMIQNKPYLGYDPQSPPCRAVRYAVWFAAMNAISEEEAQLRMGQSRAECIQQYRRFVDLALYQANIMLTTDLPTLQAMCTYLISARINDSSRRIWTMTALTVRVAQAIGLHAENASHTPFEKEQRRRLWHQIRFLDIMTGHDRGTEPLVYEERSEIPFPSNINDAEFDENSTIIVSHDNCLTDMAFGLMICDATCFIDKLNRPEYKPSGDTWQKRLELAQEFGMLAQQKYRQYCDLSNPYHRLVNSVGQTIAASFILRAVRPMQRHISSVPPRVDSPYVLSIATACLRENYKVVEDKELQAWRWLIWVQWHALSVALAGLCSIRDTELADEAWFYSQDAYHRLSESIADARTGMLWRPIEKLHRKATAFRNGMASHPTPPYQSYLGGGNDVQQIQPHTHSQSQLKARSQSQPHVQSQPQLHTQMQQQPQSQPQYTPPQQSFQQNSSHLDTGFNPSSTISTKPPSSSFNNNQEANWAFPFDMSNHSANSSQINTSHCMNHYDSQQPLSNGHESENISSFPMDSHMSASFLQQQVTHQQQHQSSISGAPDADPMASIGGFVGDVSWLDWERMMQDLPDVNPDGSLATSMNDPAMGVGIQVGGHNGVLAVGAPPCHSATANDGQNGGQPHFQQQQQQPPPLPPPPRHHDPHQQHKQYQGHQQRHQQGQRLSNLNGFGMDATVRNTGHGMF